MNARHGVRICVERSTRGPAGIAQGVYGERGNLELVVADERDGLWVFWFNSDLPEDPPAADVPPGSWSRGLRFGEGAPYLTAEIHQSPLGPDHLEVVALTAAGDVESWFWAPEQGFARRLGTVTGGATGIASAIDADGTLRVTAATVDGDRTWTAGPEVYPSRDWRDRGGSVRERRVEAVRLLSEAGVPGHEVQPGSARVIRSTRHGGTDEVVYRDADGALRHLAVLAPHRAG